ncbi:MAG: MFS transporter [Herpetosiphonaceae bacterium]|nr:MFS transporter [Herpetosiphonaceae bacterium]
MEVETPASSPVVEHSGWRAGLNRNVIVLGLVSLFTDISSEMLVPIRFLFLVNWMGTPLVLASLIEGLTEAASSLLKVGVGKRTDRVQRRTPMILLGYSLSNLAKPLIGWVPSWQPALGLLLTDRIGKAIRGAPRDTMIADSVPARYRGKAFGFHRSMDTAGAALGPLLTALILSRTSGSLPGVFKWTLVPGVLGILIIPLFLREKPREASTVPKAAAQVDVPATPLGRRFWTFTLIWALFSLGNSSDSFIFLRSVDIDAQLIRLPLYYAAMNVTYALLATPLGALSDRIGRLPILILSLGVFALAYAGWNTVTQSWQILGLFLLYGLYYAATEGIARAFVADLIPQGRRGVALGWFTAMTGLAVLPANLAAAYLWNHFGHPAPFRYGALLAAIAAIALLLCWQALEQKPVRAA